jgi:hypothetical protein
VDASKSTADQSQVKSLKAPFNSIKQSKMSNQPAKVEVIIHSISESGLPDMNKLLGRVCFIHDGAVLSGYPVMSNDDDDDDDDDDDEMPWESTVDGLGGVTFYNVTHWVEFPEAICKVVKDLKSS